MTFLWTDTCFLTVLSIAFIITVISLRKTHIRLAFKHLLSNMLSLSAGIVLFIFLIIGVLDSIHLTSSQDDQVKDNSIIDYLLWPLGETYEKTYSAPLSLYLFSTETMIINGRSQQVYPRLKYPPAHLKNNQDASLHIRNILLKSLGFTFLSLFFIAGVLIALRRFCFSLSPFTFEMKYSLPFFTLFICFFLIYAGYWLSRDFHFLGTGKIGQDIFYYTIKSIHTGLIIGILTTLFMLPLALFLGIAAGYFGGFIDDIIQYLYTTLSSIPGVLLITASVLSLQTWIANHPEQFPTLAQSADARLLALCFILGVTSWTSLCRLLRAEALKLRKIDYVLAARALGSNAFWIIRKHLLPNVMPLVLITLVLDFSFLVLAEAVLSYVGVGVSPMTISWGNMINGARLELAREPLVWWPMFAAFIFMFTLVLASNLFADAVRDAFDPHHAGR